jgi:hypothetical protein
MQDFTYLKLTRAQQLAIIYRLSGLEIDDFCSRLPTGRKKQGKAGPEEILGVTAETVKDWLVKHPYFKFAWDQTEQDPAWARLNVAAPITLASLHSRDIEYLWGMAGPYQGFPAKRAELLMLSLGEVNRPQTDPLEALRSLVGKVDLPALQAPTPPPANMRVEFVDGEVDRHDH